MKFISMTHDVVGVYDAHATPTARKWFHRHDGIHSDRHESPLLLSALFGSTLGYN
jgi:hypothetical protein